MRTIAVLSICVIFLMVLAVGCGGKGNGKLEEQKKAMEAKIADAKAGKQPMAPQLPPTQTDIRVTSSKESGELAGTAYQYDPLNKPDPFKPYRPSVNIAAGTKENPLLKYEVRYFKLVGIIRSDNPVAIFEDPSGKSYTVHVGTQIGKSGGVVKAILEDAVIITETRLSWRTEGTETVEMMIRLRAEEEKTGK